MREEAAAVVPVIEKATCRGAMTKIGARRLNRHGLEAKKKGDESHDAICIEKEVRLSKWAQGGDFEQMGPIMAQSELSQSCDVFLYHVLRRFSAKKR